MNGSAGADGNSHAESVWSGKNSGVARWILVPALLACSDGNEDPDALGDTLSSEDCELSARLPGLERVVPAPRDDVVAEVLALTCIREIAAPQALYEQMAAELAAIIATDGRMDISHPDALGNVYPLHSAFAAPPVLTAWDHHVEAARALQDPSSCGARITAALGGTVSEGATAVGTRYIRVSFPMRLNVPVLVATYLALGIDLQPQSLVGDGSRVAFALVEGGRDYWFQLRGGDCPSGCSSNHQFWWRVAAGETSLIGEWGSDYSNGSWFGDQPESFDASAFDCP